MAHRLRRRAMALLCRTRLYRYTLAGRTPREFVKNLAIRWPGNGKPGAALLAGNFQIAGETVHLAAPYAAPDEASTDCLAEIHGFAYHPQLAAQGSTCPRVLELRALVNRVAHKPRV